ncbi:hypothetical protein KI387_003817 [Taxus chinensis]|uniref:SHSP domain-containing protein n=1 Tax=Taxus chinensis TaxID=29808 RepID=A0AA38GZ40_TAXCH|nr:hypothetical protein KI387_003817 [Taxus chinensis]
MELANRNSYGFEYLSVSTHAVDPPFELVQTGDSYILVVYVPGFRKEDIKVEITDNAQSLKISGEKVLRELIGMRWTWHRLERSVGRGFSRTFRNPHNVNTNAITAKFHDHILYVVMPKISALAIQCEETLENSRCIGDHSNPIGTSSCAQDQLPGSRDQQDEVQPVFEKPCSISDEENCSYHTKNLPEETDVDDKMEAQDASPISYESSAIQEKNDSDGEKDGLESGFDYRGFFSRRTTVLLSMGVASLAIFAAHKLISRRK